MANKWALLCGGDYYAGGTARPDLPQSGPKNLNGCVRDVKEMKKLLLKLGVPKSNIQMLTASVQKDCDSSVEDPKLWPTWKNIKKALERIGEKASATNGKDHLLYFHYSGHGTLRHKVLGMFDDEGESKDDLNGTALVMTDVASGGAYLTGRQLGLWIQRMVEKSGFRATVVLDSCFSGDGLRWDDGEPVLTARSLDEPDCSVIQADKDAESHDPDETPGDTRDADAISSCWLADPKRCAVVTACSNRETASERRFGSRVQGVLSHWLIHSLSEFSDMESLPSHTRTVDYIRGRIGSTQRPMIYGEGLFQFFGLDSYRQRESCIASSDGKDIKLNIGSAQGVVRDSIYNVYQQELSDTAHLLPIPQPSRIKVTRVESFQSFAKPLGQALGKDWQKDQIRLASLHQWVLPRQVPIRYNGDEPHRELLAAELKKIPNLVLRDIQPESRHFVISLDKKSTFRIAQNQIRISRLPAISINDSIWPEKLARLLNHVSRFQALQDAYSLPRGGWFPQSDFEFATSSETVRADDDVTLSLKYKGSCSKFWLSLYYFSASWGITKLWPSPGSSAQEITKSSPGEETIFEEDVTMRFSPRFRASDPGLIEDRFVFFVSNAPKQVPSWGDIELPSLQPSETNKRIEWAACPPSDDGGGIDDDGQREADGIKGKPKRKNTEWAAIVKTVKTQERPPGQVSN